MRIIGSRMAGALLAVLCATVGCGTTTTAAPTTAAPTAAVPAPPPLGLPDLFPRDAADVLRCLGELPGGAKATEPASLPPGGVSSVSVDVPRPDLPKGINRITAVAFDDATRAADFARGSGAFVRGTGGAAEVLGRWVVTSVFGGDPEIVGRMRGCVSG